MALSATERSKRRRDKRQREAMKGVEALVKVMVAGR